MSQSRNVDDLIVKVENAALGIETPDVVNPIEKSDPEPDAIGDDVQPEPEDSGDEPQDPQAEDASKPEAKQEVDAELDTDEYGNKTEKPKMYSEEDVQRMIRERLARGKHAEQPTQQ